MSLSSQLEPYTSPVMPVLGWLKISLIATYNWIGRLSLTGRTILGIFWTGPDHPYSISSYLITLFQTRISDKKNYLGKNDIRAHELIFRPICQSQTEASFSDYSADLRFCKVPLKASNEDSGETIGESIVSEVNNIRNCIKEHVILVQFPARDRQ